MSKLSDWLVYPIIEEDITKNPKIKKALKRLIDKNLLPKSYAVNIDKLQSFLNTNPQVFTSLLKLLGESDYTFGPDWIPTSLGQRKKMKKLHNKPNRSIRGEAKGDVVVVYSGRFQPFHLGHYSTYKKLVQKFGKDKVFIGTSNKTQSGRSPLNFKEKKSIITKFFSISPKMIVQVRNPYSPVEILKDFPKDTTYVAAVGEKDSKRLKGKYFKPYKKGQFVPYEEGGFVLAVPPTDFKIGGEPVSGTKVRATFGGSVNMSAKEELFKRMYKKVDKKILQFLIRKFGGTLSEATTTTQGNLDDGPPTYYASYSDYRKYSTAWLLDLYGEDWKVLDHLVYSEFDPLEDYTLKYNTVPAVSYLDAGTIKGSKDAVKKYKKFIQNITDDFGWDVIKWLGVDAAEKSLTGTVLSAGVGKDLTDQHDLKENVKEIAVRPKPKKFRDIYDALPIDLKKRVMNLKNYDQRRDAHPEGNVLKHTIAVTNRALKTGDIDFALSALFHDIGKDSTAKLHPKKGFWTHYGHEKVSAVLVKKYATWIKSMGGDVDTIHYIVKQHMRMKVFDKMKWTKQDKMSKEKHFGKLQKFTKFDKGGRGINDSELKESVFSDSKQLFIEDKELLLMGGAYGHLAHPFDDNRLTFRDLKTMIDLALQGKLESVSEKTDGQNLMISFINGKVRAARNKGQLKNFGQNSLDIKGIQNMFSGRGEIEKAFTYSMKDLEMAIKKLGKKDLDSIFGNGKSFMSLEVMYVPTTNVIPYGINLLVFHGTMTYNEKGEAIGQSKSAGSKLTKLIKKVNGNVQKHFDIQALPNTKLPKVKDYQAKKSTFLNRVNKLQKQYGLADTDTAGDYHQHFWLEFILSGAKSSDYPNPTDNVLYSLMKRWAFFDKSYKIPTIKKDLKEYPKFLQWVLAVDKQDQTKIWKKNISAFEKIFLDLGAEILSNMENFLSANPTQAAVTMRKEIAKTIKKIRSSNDLRTIDMMKAQLDKVQSMGGFKKLVPTEGITFMFKGKVYKLTGLFAPINQILGMLKYTR